MILNLQKPWIRAFPTLIIFGKIRFLLISENEFSHEMKSNGMTSFLDFMLIVSLIMSLQGKCLVSCLPLDIPKPLLPKYATAILSIFHVQTSIADQYLHQVALFVRSSIEYAFSLRGQPMQQISIIYQTTMNDVKLCHCSPVTLIISLAENDSMGRYLFQFALQIKNHYLI